MRIKELSLRSKIKKILRVLGPYLSDLSIGKYFQSHLQRADTAKGKTDKLDHIKKIL